MQCQASTGVGDVCDLSASTCSCDNVCGELMVNSSPGYAEHYCYENCSQTVACEDQNHICVGFTNDGIAGCLPRGTFKFAWRTKVFEEGTQLGMGQVTQIPNIEDATLDGQSLNLNLMAGTGYTDVNTGEEFVLLLVVGGDPANTSAQWTLLLIVPIEKWTEGELLTGYVEEDQVDPYSDFMAQLEYTTFNANNQVESAYIMGYTVAGVINLTKVTQPGDVGRPWNPNFSEGALELLLVNYKAKYQID